MVQLNKNKKNKRAGGNKKMLLAVSLIWLFAILLNLMLLIYFCIGTTAFNNRPPGTEWGYYFTFIGFPTAFLIAVSILCLVMGWIPRIIPTQIILVIIIGVITFFVIYIAPLPIEKEGWLTEKVRTLSYMQTTEDGKYEYTLELINTFQKDGYARLYVKDVVTDEEKRIPLHTKRKKITIRGFAHGEENAWSHLIVSETSASVYVLTITEWLSIENEQYEINITEGTARRIE